MNPQPRVKSDLPSNAPQAATPAWRKWAKQLLRAVLLITTLTFVGKELWRRLSVIDWDQVEVSWPLVGLALAVSTFASALPVVSVRFALQSFIQQVPGWIPLASATWLPAMGKYVPGKFLSVAGGVWMLRKLHVSLMAAGVAMFLLNGFSVLIGVLLSIPLAWWEPVKQEMPGLGVISLVLLAVGCCCLHPRVIGTVATFVLSKLKRPQPTYVPRWNDHAVPLAVITVQFLLQGVALWLVANAFESIPLSWMPAFISINGLALSVGFMALFAPGGIGVREGILLLVLTPATASAALVVITMRGISLLGELILAGLGLTILLSPLWRRACEEADSQGTSGLTEQGPAVGETKPAAQAA